MRRALKAVVTAAVLALSGTAHAGVIYRWVDAEPNPHIGAFAGLLEFDYSVWSANGDYSADGRTVKGLVTKPMEGLLRFEWSNPSEVGFTHAIDASYQPCDYDYRSCADYFLDPGSMVLADFAVFYATLNLTFDSFLTGSIYARNEGTDVRMGSNGPLWTILRGGSDSNGICSRNDGRCWGSTGFWALDLSSLPVDEPPVLLLMGIGLAFALRHRKTRF